MLELQMISPGSPLTDKASMPSSSSFISEEYVSKSYLRQVLASERETLLAGVASLLQVHNARTTPVVVPKPRLLPPKITPPPVKTVTGNTEGFPALLSKDPPLTVVKLVPTSPRPIQGRLQASTACGTSNLAKEKLVKSNSQLFVFTGSFLPALLPLPGPTSTGKLCGYVTAPERVEKALVKANSVTSCSTPPPKPSDVSTTPHLPTSSVPILTSRPGWLFGSLTAPGKDDEALESGATMADAPKTPANLPIRPTRTQAPAPSDASDSLVEGPEVQGPKPQGPELQGPELQGPELRGPEQPGPELQKRARISHETKETPPAVSKVVTDKKPTARLVRYREFRLPGPLEVGKDNHIRPEVIEFAGPNRLAGLSSGMRKLKIHDSNHMVRSTPLPRMSWRPKVRLSINDDRTPLKLVKDNGLLKSAPLGAA